MHRPTDAELMQEMHARLTERMARDGIRFDRPPSVSIHAGHDPLGDTEKVVRRERSLRHCHLPKENKATQPAPNDSRTYIPELADRLERDRRLTDGARRCARLLAGYTYRKHRETRVASITVSYLAKALGKCRRQVQRYLRQLEAAGYIEVDVIPSKLTRMCTGLAIRLLAPLFPWHRRHRWPQKGRNPDATGLSQIYRPREGRQTIPRIAWALRCCEGVWRSYMKTLSPLPAFPITV